MDPQVYGIIALVCFLLFVGYLSDHEDHIRKWYYQARCNNGKHRLHETAANPATGWPITGTKCYECGRKWDLDGNERPANGRDD